ncbi:hypothetical protein JTE90_006556 [Oedothorax gibbosus]|uniref:Uncharacterized protein n=1 Tax=Oedothorax gibbosus TaxID=931172 RepID=A0AAV6VM67_9ARAC|nr:hypothetical protein JTE90_006556 [Oedothorax gibbosus]
MNEFGTGQRKAVFLFILVISFIIITEQAHIKKESSEHSIYERMCNIRGEECLKDIDCCMGECICYKNSCKCGTRPKIKNSEFGAQPKAQKLVCYYK